MALTKAEKNVLAIVNIYTKCATPQHGDCETVTMLKKGYMAVVETLLRDLSLGRFSD